jgi:hypothetical protein
VWLACAGGIARAQPTDSLTRARVAYNEGRYVDAIAAARLVPATRAEDQAAAALVTGRSRLERFRATADPYELATARETLGRIDATRLSARDRLELVVGLAEALYLEESFGPASEVFRTVLNRLEELDQRSQDRVLDWWASAVDRHARSIDLTGRPALYAEMAQRLDAELARNPASAAALYWQVAAMRGLGDLDRAWNAAVAAWVRATLAPDRGVALRTDLNRLVVDALVPERARRLAGPGRPDTEAVESLAAEWSEVKARWP